MPEWLSNKRHPVVEVEGDVKIEIEVEFVGQPFRAAIERHSDRQRPGTALAFEVMRSRKVFWVVGIPIFVGGLAAARTTVHPRTPE